VTTIQPSTGDRPPGPWMTWSASAVAVAGACPVRIGAAAGAPTAPASSSARTRPRLGYACAVLRMARSIVARPRALLDDQSNYMIVNASVAMVFSHMMASLPPLSFMSTKFQVSSSTVLGSVDRVIGARTTSLSGV